ncbi:Uncharacterised protein [Mycobacteroides abscessus subsp. massiliense]|nr:Uncharacterised protein [Mycobacteroides abscessus subsp. massiliense]
MVRSAARAASTSVSGSIFSASTSNARLASALATNSASREADSALRAEKNLS